MDALQNYEAALRLAPENGHAWVGLGSLAQRKGAKKQAPPTTFHAPSNSSPRRWPLLARALELSGHHAEAEVANHISLLILPDFAQAQEQASQN